MKKHCYSCGTEDNLEEIKNVYLRSVFVKHGFICKECKWMIDKS